MDFDACVECTCAVYIQIQTKIRLIQEIIFVFTAGIKKCSFVTSRPLQKHLLDLSVPKEKSSGENRRGKMQSKL